MRSIICIALCCAMTAARAQAEDLTAAEGPDDHVSAKNCPLDISIVDEKPEEPICRPDALADKRTRSATGILLGVPFGAAGFAVGLLVACPIMDAYILSNPPSGDAGMGAGLFLGLCPILIAGKSYSVGSSISAAPFIGIKRGVWDCPRDAFYPPFRTGTVVHGKPAWDQEPISLSPFDVREAIDADRFSRVSGKLRVSKREKSCLRQ
jgi:hypothetical protein